MSVYEKIRAEVLKLDAERGNRLARMSKIAQLVRDALLKELGAQESALPLPNLIVRNVQAITGADVVRWTESVGAEVTQPILFALPNEQEATYSIQYVIDEHGRNILVRKAGASFVVMPGGHEDGEAIRDAARSLITDLMAELR